MQVHNETCNIWTHLIALGVVLKSLVDSVTSHELPLHDFMADASWSRLGKTKMWPMQYLLLTSVLLFAVSTIYHTFFCMNEKVSCILLRVDYGGVCLIVSGGMIPVI